MQIFQIYLYITLIYPLLIAPISVLTEISNGANCVNHWREVLHADQFEQALGLAGY